MWNLRDDLYTVLKRKAMSEARKIVECVEQTNGYEAWRLLGIRYEPQGGMRRMRDLTALTMLQSKRCKNASETMVVLLEIDRMRKKITEGGGSVDDDVLVTTLWSTMDGQTRTHVSSKIDMELTKYLELRQAVMNFTNLVTATGRGGAVAMDIGSIESSHRPDGVLTE